MPVFCLFFFSHFLNFEIWFFFKWIGSSERVGRIVGRNRRSNIQLGLTWRHAVGDTWQRRQYLCVRCMLRLNTMPMNFGGTWRSVHRQIWLIFAASDRSTSEMLISGVIFINQWLHDEDLVHGSSGGAWGICRKCNAKGHTWRCVYGRMGLWFVWFDRSRDGLLICVISLLKIWELWYGAFGWDFWVEETNRAFGWDFWVKETNRNDEIYEVRKRKDQGCSLEL